MQLKNLQLCRAPQRALYHRHMMQVCKVLSQNWNASHIKHLKKTKPKQQCRPESIIYTGFFFFRLLFYTSTRGQSWTSHEESGPQMISGSEMKTNPTEAHNIKKNPTKHIKVADSAFWHLQGTGAQVTSVFLYFTHGWIQMCSTHRTLQVGSRERGGGEPTPPPPPQRVKIKREEKNKEVGWGLANLNINYQDPEAQFK